MNEAMVYQTLLWIGALGVAVMGVLGAAAHGSHAHGSHGGHHGIEHGHGVHHAHGEGIGHGSHGHVAHGHVAHGQNGHGPAAHHGHHDATGAHSHGHHGDHYHGDHAGGSAAPLLAVMSWLSPMMLFSVSLGAGATGMLLEKRLPVMTTALFAVLVGFALFLLVVRPFTAFVQRFASKPAQALEGTVAKEAIAQNRFDTQGRGIVSVIIDGQIVRLLAHMERDDLAKGVAVAPGDHLLVTHVDESKNTCRVTKL